MSDFTVASEKARTEPCPCRSERHEYCEKCYRPKSGQLTDTTLQPGPDEVVVRREDLGNVVGLPCYWPNVEPKGEKGDPLRGNTERSILRLRAALKEKENER